MAKFARYLPEFGWQPTVVTVQPIVYLAQDESLSSDLARVRVIRTDSWDPQRLLMKFKRQNKPVAAQNTGSTNPGKLLQFINQKLFSFFLIPDSKVLWNPLLYKSITRLLHGEKFDVVLTSSPPHSTHLVGKKLAAKYGLKWVADFRDDWAGGHVVFEPTRIHRWVNHRLQKAVLAGADAVICASPGIRSTFLDKTVTTDKFHIITNGYDIADYPPASKSTDKHCFTLCYCGVISRFSDPASLFKALLLFKIKYPVSWKQLRIQFVGHDASGKLADMVHKNSLDDLVEIIGFKPHNQALQYVVNADALLLLATGNDRDTFIPGKIFEYFGAQKPILGISNVKDTSELLQKYSMARFLSIDKPEEIADALHDLMSTNLQILPGDLAFIEQFNRKTQTEKLANIFNGLKS